MTAVLVTEESKRITKQTDVFWNPIMDKMIGKTVEVIEDECSYIMVSDYPHVWRLPRTAVKFLNTKIMKHRLGVK